eukprot:6475709-Amphidinium_carterae.1
MASRKKIGGQVAVFGGQISTLVAVVDPYGSFKRRCCSSCMRRDAVYAALEVCSIRSMSLSGLTILGPSVTEWDGRLATYCLGIGLRMLMGLCALATERIARMTNARISSAYCRDLYHQCRERPSLFGMAWLVYIALPVPQDMEYFDVHRSGELISRLNSDTKDATNQLASHRQQRVICIGSFESLGLWVQEICQKLLYFPVRFVQMSFFLLFNFAMLAWTAPQLVRRTLYDSHRVAGDDDSINNPCCICGQSHPHEAAQTILHQGGHAIQEMHDIIELVESSQHSIALSMKA